LVLLLLVLLLLVLLLLVLLLLAGEVCRACEQHRAGRWHGSCSGFLPADTLCRRGGHPEV